MNSKRNTDSSARQFCYGLLGLCLLLLGCVAPPSEAGADAVITVEYYNRGRGGTTHFSLVLMSDGAVIFDGKNGTRVSGIARSAIDRERVQKWLEALIATGALDRKDSPIPADSGWFRLAVKSAQNQNTFRFGDWKPNPTSKLLREIFHELQVFEKWVVYKFD